MIDVSSYRRMSFAVVFAALAVAVGFSAVTANSVFSRVILVWIAANALTISVAYFTSSPGVYGKKERKKERKKTALFDGEWLSGWLRGYCSFERFGIFKTPSLELHSTVKLFQIC